MPFSIDRLIRRRLSRKRNVAPKCNICGHGEFKAGPKGRMGKGGKPPMCTSCNSLERHRIARAAWSPLVGTKLRRLKAIQFSPDPSVKKEWFNSFEVSIYGKKNSLDLQDIERPSDHYDVAICNHVLEHIEDDRQAFREIMRILSPTGFFQFTVPTPYTRSVTEEWGYPDEDLHGHYRWYGSDLVDRFCEARPQVKLLWVEGVDDVTGKHDFVYFASLDDRRLDKIGATFGKVFGSVETAP